MYQSEDGSFTLAAAGDAMITRRLSVCEDEGLEELLDYIRTADASVVNLEMLIHEYEGYPAPNMPGPHMRAPPWAADELTSAGFDMFAVAHNHVDDYLHGGMLATMRELEQRDIPYAGLGRNLSHAREPAYFDTPRGRVALVAACSTISMGSEAGRQGPNLQGRPGLSPLRLETRYEVPSEQIEQLHEISEDLGLEAVKAWNEKLGGVLRMRGKHEDGFNLLNMSRGPDLVFEEADEANVRQRANERDADEILTQVRAANRQADWVVVSLHAHEGPNGEYNQQENAPFIERFAHDCVDAGADAFVGHGPHVLRGIEIYDGAPVFYSLSNFMFQIETITRIPAEVFDPETEYDAVPADFFDRQAYDEDGNRWGFLAHQMFWDSVLPITHFTDGTLDSIDLYPMELGFDEQRPRRGRPQLVSGDEADRILSELQRLSEPYGTEIEIENGRGCIRAEPES